MQELGFPIGLNYNGEEVHRTAGISNKKNQRAKTLNHTFQRELRQNKLDKRKQEQFEKIEKERIARLRLFNSNMAVEEKIKKLCPVENIIDVPLEIFSKLTKNELTDFVKVRKYKGPKADRTETYKLPKNKGKINDQEATLISEAFNARTDELKLIMKDGGVEVPQDNEEVPQEVPPTIVQARANLFNITSVEYILDTK